MKTNKKKPLKELFKEYEEARAEVSNTGEVILWRLQDGYKTGHREIVIVGPKVSFTIFFVNPDHEEVVDYSLDIWSDDPKELREALRFFREHYESNPNEELDRIIDVLENLDKAA